MSTVGATASRLAIAEGSAASGAVEASGEALSAAISAVGMGIEISVDVVGSTPSGEGQPVVLLIDAAGDRLEIDNKGAPLLVQAGVMWSGRSASEVV